MHTMKQGKVSPDDSINKSNAEKHDSRSDSDSSLLGEALFNRGRGHDHDLVVGPGPEDASFKTKYPPRSSLTIVPDDKEQPFVFGMGENNKHTLLEVIDARRKLEEIYRTKGIVISPHSPVLKTWNLVLVWVTVFTVLWTPFQIAFVPYDRSPESLLYVLNRVTDTLFFLDTFIGFFVSYTDGVTGDYIRDSKDIAKHYLYSWFLLDALSSCCGFVDFIDTTELTESAIAGWQVAKLLRLGRLPKTFASGRTKSPQRLFEDRLSYNTVSLLKFIVAIVVLAHWIACAWRGVDNFGEPGKTWMGELTDTDDADVYALCMYFAATTITTIGYGDVGNPTTTAERVLATFCMIAGALMWAYIIGGVCAIVQSFNQSDIAFKETMDKLNQFLLEKRMPKDMRARIREYFVQRRLMLRDIEYSELMTSMSPALRGEVARYVNRQWLYHVPWLRGGTPGFVASIALALEPELYAPKETILGNELRVLVRGVAVKDACIYTRGCVWGIDIILQSKRLQRKGLARALTYAQIYTLSQSRLEELLDHYPMERTRLRVSAIWMALRRGFIQYASDINAAKEHIVDIAQQAEARGVNFKELFEKYDEDSSGDLSTNEFRKVLKGLGFVLSDSILQLIIERYDEDKTGSVDYIEFLTFFAPHVLQKMEDKIAEANGIPRHKSTGNILTSRRMSKNKHTFALVNAFTNGSEGDQVRELVMDHGHGNRHMEKRIEEVVAEKFSSLQNLLQLEIRSLASSLNNASVAEAGSHDIGAKKKTKKLSKAGLHGASLPVIKSKSTRSLTFSYQDDDVVTKISEK